MEKHFRIKSSDIKTWRFGDDMSPLSNVNYNKIGNVYKERKVWNYIRIKRDGVKQKNVQN